MLLTPDELGEIDLIEARIVDLEKRVIGNLQSTENFPVTDALVTTNTLITTALTRREAANTFMRRLGELDKLLDPATEDNTLDTSAKLEEILVMEPQLRQNVKSLNLMQELLPVLDSEAVKNVPCLTDRLEKLTLFHLEKKQEADNMTANVMDLVQQYNAIIVNMTKLFVQFEDIVTKCEIAAQPKKEIE